MSPSLRHSGLLGIMMLTIRQTWTKLVEGEVYDEKKLNQFVASN